MQTIVITDENGNPVETHVALAELSRRPGFSLFGMDIQTIIALRSEYFHLGGNMPITPSSVQEIFRK